MDKYILVTNANTNLGSELIKKLISENYLVFASDINFENKKFGNLIYLNLDPNDKRSLENAKKYILKYTSKIYSIIHLANYISFSSMLDCNVDELEKSFETNFYSIFKTNQAFWDLLEQRSGRIIHDCSDVSLYALAPFNGVYSLAKSLLCNYSDILRRELKFKGINVVKVHTGLIKDERFEEAIESYHRAAEESKYFFSEISRFMDLHLSKDSLISVNQYLDFIIDIVNTKRVKASYYYKCNKKLKKLNKYPNFLKDLYFKNFQK